MRKPYEALLLALALTVLSTGIGFASTWAATPRRVMQVTAKVRMTRPKPMLRIAHSVRRSTPVASLYAYTVQPGDTLSAIAARLYGNENTWPALWWVNKSHIANPDVIQIGQRLKLSAWHPLTGWLLADALKATNPVVITVSRTYSADEDSRSTVATVPSYHTSHAYQAPESSYSSPSNYSGFQQCVITRESGGNAQVMNSTGHYGLYQFSASTWAAYGGNPGDFGHASVAEQNRVFANAMAQPGGASNWSPYDGC